MPRYRRARTDGRGRNPWRIRFGGGTRRSGLAARWCRDFGTKGSLARRSWLNVIDRLACELRYPDPAAPAAPDWRTMGLAVRPRLPYVGHLRLPAAVTAPAAQLQLHALALARILPAVPRVLRAPFEVAAALAGARSSQLSIDSLCPLGPVMLDPRARCPADRTQPRLGTSIGRVECPIALVQADQAFAFVEQILQGH